jgi:2-(1,2-epoxy-1,2-dihydrophenyl)acetyl-CoA isomerase
MGDSMQVRDSDGVRTIILDRPERKNPLNLELIDAIGEGLFSGSFGAVVLGSESPDIFSAGGDFTLGHDAIVEISDRVFDLCRRLATTPTVFIVASNGLAITGGAQLFLAADQRVIGPRARLRVSIPDRNLLVGSWSLPQMAGRSLSLDLLLSGRDLEAVEMYRLGIAREPVGNPVAAAKELAHEYAALDHEYRLRVKDLLARQYDSEAAITAEEFGFDANDVVRRTR